MATRTQRAEIPAWLKRFGVAGFLFFLIKGLVWLALGFGAFKGCSVIAGG